MKTIPPPCPVPDTGPKYWRSLDALADTPEFRKWAEREFPSGASELADPVTRRSFVKLMSASFLLAGFGLAGTGCRRPVENIYPFSKMPEGYIHGLAKYFATSMPTRGTAVPLLAKSNDGRPTKLEGNPNHPDSNGGTDRYVQASILNLYDPDRAIRFASNGNIQTREQANAALKAVADAAAGNKGAGLSFLAERTSSPSRERLQKVIAEKYPQATWHEYEAVDFDIHRQAATAAFGRSVTPYYKIDAADVILSLDSDFLGNEENLHVNIRRFASRRRTKTADDSMSRLYAIEGLYSVTGANADHRLRLAPSQIAAATASLLVEISGGQASGEVTRLAGSFTGSKKWIEECAKDLLSKKDEGKSLVLAGYRQPLGVHLMVNAINGILGSFGKTILLHDTPENKAGSIADLAAAAGAGSVNTLIILGGNPSYNAPVDLKWSDLVTKVKTVVRLGYYEDESFPKTGWSLPQAHFLESWGDARTADGTLVSIQPLIEPLFGGVTEIEVLARIAGLDNPNPYDIVHDTFRSLGGGDDEKWKKFKHDGFLADSATKSADGGFNAATVSAAIDKALPATVAAPTKDKLEVIFHRDYKMDDGRFNNNGWMQELPDPITKMTWENVILVSIKTAEDLGLAAKESDEKKDSERNRAHAIAPLNKENNRIKAPLVKVEVDGREIIGPLWVQPGQADYTLALALGYGRSVTGRVGRGSGYDAYTLRTTKNLHCAPNAKVTDTGRKHPLSVTQDHGTMEGRPIIREATLAEYRSYKSKDKDGNFALGFNMDRPKADYAELYPNPFDEAKKAGHHQWGMAIDLSACVGCSTCMVACQSENNVPIVGKQQVANNREMHWLRIDRYFTGDPSKEDNIQMVNQPMLCQHCEAAPCENVCPVNATSHDQEGLNVMVYNRCVGTRYCSNNCPYKVRRFNYFDYNRRTLEGLAGPVYTTPLLPNKKDGWGLLNWWNDPDRGAKPSDEWEILKLVKNPDVTVRMRGVMEKCSYCVQRIEGAKIAQKVKAGASGDVIVPRDSFKTACQQACPAEAIVFGNILDKGSQVSQLKAQDRNYSVLDFLNTKPRTTYLARIRNPNPAMPDVYLTPNSTREFETKNHANPFEGKAAEAVAGKGEA